MALTSVVFTYTLPAQCGDTVPPAAPVRCGCDNLILLVEDPALLTSASCGILEAIVREVLVSRCPVDYVDPATGVSSKVWKYDYTIEYDDAFFVNPSYKLRRCDIKYNCCRGCAQEYTDRKLCGVVRSVTGPCVNNSDPSRPIINGTAISGNIVTQVNPCAFIVDETITQLQRSGTSLIYTNENGEVADIGVCDIIQECINSGAISYCATAEAAAQFAACDQLGGGGGQTLTAGCGLIIENNEVRVAVSGGPGDWLFPCSQIEGTGVFCVDGALRGEPRHTATAIAGTINTGPDIPNLENVDDAQTIEVAQTFVNPSACRTMLLEVEGLARSYGFVENNSGPIHMEILVEVNSGGGYFPYNGYNIRKSTNPGSTPNWNYDMMTVHTIHQVIGPGATVNVGCRVTVKKLGGTGVYNFNSTGINAGIRVFGVTQ